LSELVATSVEVLMCLNAFSDELWLEEDELLDELLDELEAWWDEEELLDELELPFATY
jgi:hypothetical protein